MVGGSSVAVTEPCISSTPSSTVGTVRVVVVALAAKVTVVGAPPTMYSPSCVTCTLTCSGLARLLGLPPCRSRVKVAAVPSPTEAWSASIRTPMVSLYTV